MIRFELIRIWQDRVMGMRRRMSWMLCQGRLTSTRRGNMKRFFFYNQYHEKIKGIVYIWACKGILTPPSPAQQNYVFVISTSQAKVVASGAQMNITGTILNKPPAQISLKALIMIATISRVMITKVCSSTYWRTL